MSARYDLILILKAQTWPAQQYEFVDKLDF